MAASDAITVEATARTLIENSTAWDTSPALTTAQVDILLGMAQSTNAITSATEWTVSDLNRVVSLGWSWKSGIASALFKTGVGPGKTFDLQDQYNHCVQMSTWYGDGTLSVVGSANASDGTRRSGIGSIGLTSVMNS